MCIFIVFSCIGILTDCLLFLVIYSFMDICERICREMHTYVSDRDLYAF
ncbi:putative lipoprotein [Phocaeicola vulgatus str. 3975 RP4]|uniref:Putative lipoprotein n=1 Tax=Phocaeicola vulgatus str. 3975 RP4 TaxID=1339352 RepID=A0A069SB46_PHOVU|nr:putative lipoprotein [Phocaeicola vulgatus str. 3975 RP4]